MAAPPAADAAALEAALAAADAAVVRQGDAVRALKAAAKEGTASKVRREGACDGEASLRVQWGRRGRGRGGAECARQPSGRRPISRLVCLFSQDDVDAAIKALQDLKLEREAKIKVRKREAEGMFFFGVGR